MRRSYFAAAAMGILLAVAFAAAPRVVDAQVSTGAAPTDSVQEALRAFGLTKDGVELNGRYVLSGGTVVEKGDTVAGPVVTIRGNAEIRGRVTGGVYALWGDVIIHPGAEVVGGANAFRGRVIIDGGRVRGDMQSWTSAAPAEAAEAAAPMTTGRALQLAAAWTGMLVAIALLVLVIASANLEATVRALEEDFGRALFIGVLGQLGFLPLLLFAIVALAVTVIGILLIPFVLVAAPVAFAGFVTLGWLALALLTGRALVRSREASGSRSEALRALVVGAVVLMLPWLIAAALQGAGAMALVARIVAIGITWVTATAGLGATLVSRAGSARPRVDSRPAEPLQGWQTPTPVAGVATARRPIPARPGATPK